MAQILYITQVGYGYIFGIDIVSVRRNAGKLFQIIAYLEIQSEMSAEHFRVTDT